MIATCLEKNPGARYASAAEVREALKTIMKALQIETGHHSRRCCGQPAHHRAGSGEAHHGISLDAGGAVSRVGRRPRAAELSRRAAVCKSWRDRSGAALWLCAGRRDCRAAGAHSGAGGAAFEHADVAARSRRWIRLSVGQKLLVSFVLAGNFLRSEKGFDLNWQLLDVARRACARAEPSAWRRWI